MTASPEDLPNRVEPHSVNPPHSLSYPPSQYDSKSRGFIESRRAAFGQSSYSLANLTPYQIALGGPVGLTEDQVITVVAGNPPGAILDFEGLPKIKIAAGIKDDGQAGGAGQGR
jgi:hypothetical protein